METDNPRSNTELKSSSPGYLKNYFGVSQTVTIPNRESSRLSSANSDLAQNHTAKQIVPNGHAGGQGTYENSGTSVVSDQMAAHIDTGNNYSLSATTLTNGSLFHDTYPGQAYDYNMLNKHGEIQSTATFPGNSSGHPAEISVQKCSSGNEIISSEVRKLVSVHDCSFFPSQKRFVGWRDENYNQTDSISVPHDTRSTSYQPQIWSPISSVDASISSVTSGYNPGGENLRQSVNNTVRNVRNETQDKEEILSNIPTEFSQSQSSEVGTNSPIQMRKHRRKTTTPVQAKSMSHVLEKINPHVLKSQHGSSEALEELKDDMIQECNKLDTKQNVLGLETATCGENERLGFKYPNSKLEDTTAEIQFKPLCSKLFTSGPQRRLDTDKPSKTHYDVNQDVGISSSTNRYSRHFLKQFCKSATSPDAENMTSDMPDSNSDNWKENSYNDYGDDDDKEVDDNDDDDDSNEYRKGNSMQTDTGVSISEKSLLAENEKMEADYDTFRCEACGKECESEGHLLTHYLCHSAEGKQHGRLKELNFSKQLQDFSSFEQPGLFMCNVCDKDFHNLTNLQLHMETHVTITTVTKNEKRDYACTVCQKTFSLASALQLHRQIHLGSSPYKCHDCGKSFRDKTRLTIHLRVHTGEKPFDCDICGKSFSQKGNLKLHRKIHTEEKPCKCDICGHTFRQKNDLMRHWKTHTGNQSLNCPVCTLPASNNEELQEHMLSHGALQKDVFNELTGLVAESGSKFPTKVKKVYRCEECSLDFVSFPEFQKHLKCHKDKTQAKVACNTCGKELSGSSFLEHMKTHTGEKPYTCIFCGKYFRRSHHLQTHLRTHTGDKPYHCEDCGKCFARGDHLQNHRRTHTGEKPYHCTQCGKSYSQSHHLLRHKRTHTGEKPYWCQLCDKKFSRDHHLKKHMETHRVVIYKEEEEEEEVATFNGRFKAEYPGLEESIATVSMATRAGGELAQLVPLPENNVASRLIESMVQKHLSRGLVTSQNEPEVNSNSRSVRSASPQKDSLQGHENGIPTQTFGDLVRQRLTEEFETYSSEKDG